ncbi:PREDICTED: uncharacterized protein LOC109186293 [Ipomoea nil]|uniref:uncharacterized protein LOC109186293 n=1 Tax=Ipomoea nil TaxID=35883 RepID=UPI000900DEB9|nr:PREDICTED: uncharacterized protein LOC109186293 [Ipomoea nil]
MAATLKITLAVVACFALSLCFHGVAGSIACENLDKESCGFAISSSGKRCVLEKHVRRGGEEAYTCRTSEIEADKKLVKDWIETEECIQACGVDRNSLGISSDALLESHFTHMLCSTPCYHRCPNIIDLYFNLAAGEGVYLPKLCEEVGSSSNARRAMAEIVSSGIVAPAPEESRPVNFIGASEPALPPF